MSYYFHPAAEAEHLETVVHYESKQPGLGTTYLIEFENGMTRICESPQRYPIEQKPEIRRKRMGKFPFNILYREETGAGTIQVLAVAHHRRRPRYWLGRF